MQKLSKGTSTCRITRIILSVFALLLWQAPAMAQGDAPDVDPGDMSGRIVDLFSADSVLNSGEIELTIPSKLKQSVAAKARQAAPPGDGTGQVETAFVFLLADVTQSSQGTSGSDSTSAGTGTGNSGARQQEQVLWYLGLLDPTQSDSAQGMQISQTPAAPIPPSVTADGSLVAFVNAEEYMICLVDTQTGEEVCDTAASGSVGGATGGGSASRGTTRQATAPSGAVDVALSPDGGMLAYVPLLETGELANYFVIRDLTTGEESPVQITDQSGQSILQAVSTVDFSDDGMMIAFDALISSQDENGETMLQWVVFIGNMTSGELMAFGLPGMLFLHPAFSHMSSDYFTFEAISGGGAEAVTVVAVVDISQQEPTIGGIIQSLPPAYPGFSADDMSLYFIAPLQDAEIGLGIANIPVDLATLQPAGDPALVLTNAIFGDAYAAGGAAGGGNTGATGTGGSSGDDESGSDDSNGDNGSGTSPF